MARQLTRTIAAILLALVAIGCAAPSPTPIPTPTPTPAPGPLTPTGVEARLRTLEPTLTLEPHRDNPTGALPDLAFSARYVTASGGWRFFYLVLVYPTPELRQQFQKGFGESHITGPIATEYQDGIAHSVWVGVDNVLVQVMLPGGQFGGRSPSPDENALPDTVRAALERAPSP